MVVQTSGVDANRFGKHSNVIAQAFSDDVEMPAGLGVAARITRLYEGAKAVQSLFDSPEALIESPESRVERFLEASHRHGQPSRAHHNIVIIARTMPWFLQQKSA